jgi:uncharacterized lipoprotein YddW (UPF0748 family)
MKASQVLRFFVAGSLFWMMAGTLSACKKPTDTESETEATSSRPINVSAFVTREYDYLDTAAGRKTMMTFAARIGLKRLFVNVWSRGCTLFRSNVVKKYGGPEICPETEGDALEDLIRLGKELNIEVVPWFEWGNIVPANSLLWKQNSGKGTNSWSGFAESFHTVPSIRINPYKGHFGTFLAELLKETVTRYGSRELHLCDNLAPHTKDGPATKIKGPDSFTTFIQKTTQPARAAGARFSLSSQRRRNSLNEFSIDWVQWKKAGLVTRIYPQLYYIPESNTQKFKKEGNEERAAGATGVVLYTGPLSQKWTLAGVGRFVKIAHSMGLESVLFDFNTLLVDQKVNSNTQIQKIASALGTQMRNLSAENRIPRSTQGARLTELPPSPSEPPVQPHPQTRESSKEQAALLPQPQQPNSAPAKQNEKLCEYMKIHNAPNAGAPTYATAEKGEIKDYAANEQLAYRHVTAINSQGEEMMYVILYTTGGPTRERWLDAKYLVERRPSDQGCSP